MTHLFDIEHYANQANARVPVTVVFGAPIIYILPGSLLGLLRLHLSGDRMHAVAAFDPLAAVDQIVRLIRLLAQQHLNAIECRTAYQWLVCARINVATDAM